MRKFYCSVLILSLSLYSISQSYKITQGQELKLHESSNDIGIVDRDNSGVYVIEGRVKTHRLSIKEPYSTAYSLYKFDKNYSLLYSKDYSKDTKGYTAHSFQSMNGKLFMFATDYNKKAKSVTIYGAGINKNTGELESGLGEIESKPMDKEDDLWDTNVTIAEDGKSFLMVTRIFGDNRRTLTVTILDSDLRKIKSVTINFPLNGPVRDAVDRVVYSDGKIFAWARRSELVNTKKDSEYKLKNYLLLVYDMNGKKQKEIAVEGSDKFISEDKFVHLPGVGIVLTGFFTFDRRKKQMDGFLIHRFNAKTGELEKSTHKDIHPSMFTSLTKGIPARFTDNFSLRSIDVNPSDNAIIVTAEYSDFSSDNYSDKSVDWRYLTQHILLFKIDKNGEIGWVNLIPKFQKEIFVASSASSGYGSTLSGGGGMPYYSSYTKLIKDNKLIIILNDDNANGTNPKFGDNLKEIMNFKKTSLYGISVDLSSGRMDRKLIAANSDDKILAPRHSFVTGDEILMPSWRDHKLGKSEFRLVQVKVD